MGSGRFQDSNHRGSLPRWVPDTSKNNSLQAISISQNMYFYLFLIDLLMLYVSRNVQRTYTSDHASSCHLQEVFVYERFELKGVDPALDRRSLTTCNRIWIYCLYRLDQGLQPSHQEGSIHSPADDGMPPQAPKDDHVFRPLNLRPLSNQELSETGLCTRFHTLRHNFLPTPILRLHPEKMNGVYLHTRSDGNLARLRAIT